MLRDSSSSGVRGALRRLLWLTGVHERSWGGVVVLSDRTAAVVSSAPLLEVEGVGCVADSAGGLDTGLLAVTSWALFSLAARLGRWPVSALFPWGLATSLHSTSQDDAAATRPHSSGMVSWHPGGSRNLARPRTWIWSLVNASPIFR